MPYPGLLHPEPLSLQQATADLYLLRRQSHTVLSQSLWHLRVLRCQTPIGFDSKCDFTPPTILLGLLLCPWMWVSLGCCFISSSKEEAKVGASLIAQLVKNLPAMQETLV